MAQQTPTEGMRPRVLTISRKTISGKPSYAPPPPAEARTGVSGSDANGTTTPSSAPRQRAYTVIINAGKKVQAQMCNQ